MSRECPKGAGGGGGETKCYNCQEMGHMAGECPKPSRKDRRKEMGWGPDDKFTCDYWNFVGKGKCRMENGHIDGGRLKVSRHHVCALCFRNTGQGESHPAVFCKMFPLPDKERIVASHQAGERGPSMVDMGLFTRAPCREEGEVDADGVE